MLHKISFYNKFFFINLEITVKDYKKIPGTVNNLDNGSQKSYDLYKSQIISFPYGLLGIKIKWNGAESSFLKKLLEKFQNWEFQFLRG